MKTPTDTPYQTWQIFNFIKNKLGGVKTITGIYGVSEDHARRWCRDPAMHFANGYSPDPLLKAGVLIRLMADEHEPECDDAVKSALGYLCAQAGYRIEKDVPAIPDKTDVALELHDDMPKWVDMQQAILNGEPPEKVRYLMGELIDEIRQNYTLYLEKRGAKK